MQVEIFSDVVCPFCWIGKRQFETALKQFEHADQVQVIYRSFELDPNTPKDIDSDIYDMLSRKYSITREQAIESNVRVAQSGSQVGIKFNIDKARVGNSFDAHRLIHLATAYNKGSEMLEALHKAYFTDGVKISDIDELVKIAQDLGFESNLVREMLQGDDFKQDVRRDEQMAQKAGVTGVPFFLIDSKFAISGAQGPDNFLSALEQISQS